MAELVSCPACGTLVADNRGEVGRPRNCVKCGAFLGLAPDDRNPYSPPSAPLGGEGESHLSALEVPSSVFGKFGLAVHLLGENFVLISLIILTVWLPANIAIGFYEFNAPEDQQVFASFRLNSLIGGVFGPISIGALIFVIGERMNGKRVGYAEAMGMGFRNWGRLFAANFFAGIFIVLGFLALIVPGVILVIRYALLNPVVVYEHASTPRQRSAELTAGRRWKILAAGLLFFMLFFVFMFAMLFAVEYVQGEVEWLNNPWVNIAVECVSDVLMSLLTILMVLFYLEARQNELARDLSGMDDGMFYSEKMSEPL
jgi:hypothetical protein